MAVAHILILLTRQTILTIFLVDNEKGFNIVNLDIAKHMHGAGRRGAARCIVRSGKIYDLNEKLGHWCLIRDGREGL